MPLYLPASETSTTADPYTLAQRKSDRGLEAEYLGASGNESTAGLVRALNNTTIVSARDAAGTGNITILATDGSDRTIMANGVHVGGSAVGVRTTSGYLALVGAAGLVVDAGTADMDIAIGSGRNFVVGLEGAASTTYFEVTEVAAGRHVISLVRGAELTTTQMPASTGDGVVYLANAATDPSANSVGGGILYESGGAFVHRGTSGTVTTVAPA